MAQNKKKESKEEKYRNISLIFFLIAIVLFVLVFSTPSLSGTKACGIKNKLIFSPSGISAIISLFFSLKSIREYKKHIATEIIIIVINSIVTICAILNIVLIKECPQKYDFTRKNDITMIVSAIYDYQVKNPGKLPETIKDFEPYLDPSLSDYTITITSTEKTIEKQFYKGKIGEIAIYAGYSACGEENGEIKISSKKGDFAIMTKLEEKDIYYCIDDN